MPQRGLGASDQNITGAGTSDNIGVPPKTVKLLRSAAIALALVVASGADTPRPVPPDRKAYEKAINTKDPREKLAALNAFVKQYPQSHRADDAWDAMLTTLCEKMPNDEAAVRETAKAYLAVEPENQRGYVYQDIADVLADHKHMLKDAEQYARQAMEATSEAQFVKMVRAGRQKVGMKELSAAELHHDYEQSQSGFAATLGRVYVLEGKTDEGRKLLEQALAYHPTLAMASQTLGMLALRQGQNDRALDYLVRARLNGKLQPDAQTALEKLYRDGHQGSLDGFNEYLDAEYRKLSPDPPPPSRYESKAGQNRVVLAELFTGAGCSPCAGADTAMDQIMERFTRGQVAVLMYHLHVPEPDPITNPGNVRRALDYDIPGTPTLEVDGERVMSGGTRKNFSTAYNDYDQAIEKAIAAPAEAVIELHAVREGNVVRVSGTVGQMRRDPKGVRAYVALVEKKIRYSGENGVRFHPMAVRSMAGDGQGFALAPGGRTDIACSFDIAKISAELSKYLDDYEKYNDRFGPVQFIEKRATIDPADVAVVAFVQDPATKHVLQAVYTDAR